MTSASPAAATAAGESSAAGQDGRRLLHVLAGLAAASLLGLGFVGVAPNRILSGHAVPVWDAVPPAWVAVLTLAIAVLGGAGFARASVLRDLAAALAAAVLLVAALLAAGEAAGRVARDVGPAARTSLGAAFWAVEMAAALGLFGAAERLLPRSAARAGLGLAVGALVAGIAATGALSDLSLAREFATRQEAFLGALLTHLALVGAALALALPLGAALGVLAIRRPGAAPGLFSGLSLVQTVPSIALFGLLLGPLTALATLVPALRAAGVSGVGAAPAVIALSLYALLPVARGVVTAIAAVPPEVVDAARGMGMTPRQIAARVLVPLALPLLLATLRIVVVQTIGLTVVAALVGAGGLGTFVFQGLGQTATDLILLGALSAIGLALLADALFRLLTPAAVGRPA